MPRWRAALTFLHRWGGLLLGLWLALLGLTGSLMVWQAEIDAALNPAWFNAQTSCGDALPDAPVARALAVLEHAAPGVLATAVHAPDRPTAAYRLWSASPRPGFKRQHFVDATCMRHLGARDWGAPRFDRAHAVPMLYELHRALLLRDAGHTAVGFAGLALLVAAFTGLMLAWPRRSSRAAWRRVLTVKHAASAQRRWHDWHRATGTWLAAFFLLMGASGAYLCFPNQVRAIVGAVLPVLPVLDADRAGPPAAPVAASQISERLPPDALVIRAQGLWPRAQWSRLALPATPDKPFEVRLLQPGEPRADTGSTRVRIDARGQIIAVRDALHLPVGDALLDWLFPLHSGEALGLPGRLAWTLFGLAPSLMFATGAWLWWRRRRAASLPARRPTEAMQAR